MNISQGNLKKALESIRRTIRWRREFGVDEMVKTMMNTRMNVHENTSSSVDWRTILRQETDSGKVYVRGYDRNGRALVYMRAALENTHNELNNMRHLVWNLEKALACTRRRSRTMDGKNGSNSHLTKINLIMDYTGFKLSNAPPMSTSKYTLDILQNHYPEMMFRAYCLYPPFVFKAFWTAIKPFIDPVTKEKIVFCSNKQGVVKHFVQAAITDVHKLEPIAGGPEERKVRPFDPDDYTTLPLDVSFDE
jgi:hypothetical protein